MFQNRFSSLGLAESVQRPWWETWVAEYQSLKTKKSSAKNHQRSRRRSWWQSRCCSWSEDGFSDNNSTTPAWRSEDTRLSDRWRPQRSATSGSLIRVLHPKICICLITLCTKGLLRFIWHSTKGTYLYCSLRTYQPIRQLFTMRAFVVLYAKVSALNNGTT